MPDGSDDETTWRQPWWCPQCQALIPSSALTHDFDGQTHTVEVLTGQDLIDRYGVGGWGWDNDTIKRLLRELKVLGTSPDGDT